MTLEDLKTQREKMNRLTRAALLPADGVINDEVLETARAALASVGYAAMARVVLEGIEQLETVGDGAIHSAATLKLFDRQATSFLMRTDPPPHEEQPAGEGNQNASE